MNSSRNKSLHILIGTVVLIALPLVIFPKLFGLQPLRLSWQYFFYEIVFYGFVGVILFRCQSLFGLAKVALAALGYRLVLSAAFGLIITTIYAMDFKVAMELALISYLPGAALQIILSPAAFWPVLKKLGQADRAPRVAARRESAYFAGGESPRMPFPSASLRERPQVIVSPHTMKDTLQPEGLNMHPRTNTEAGPVTVTSDLNGFERAVRYIAEHGSVYYASVVDPDGLLLANYYRGKIDPEDMAPLAVLFFEWNRAVLAKGRLGEAEKIDITLKEKRLILGRVGEWCLMVLSERQADDLLNIRINQGMDILRKYAAEKYASGQQTQVEKTYV
jgi:predicted regulator of Ras-like GTPase activity (Roadblock/LC7/MglB family)